MKSILAALSAPVVLPAGSTRAAELAAGPLESPSDSKVRKPLRILPLGDSITRGTCRAQKDGKAVGRPHPDAGGWHRSLPGKLRAAGIASDFAGELNCAAFGRGGVVDPHVGVVTLNAMPGETRL